MSRLGMFEENSIVVFGCDTNRSYVELALERIEKDRLARSQLEMPL